VYSFHLDRDGRVTNMAVITDRTMPVSAVYSLSPDGSRLGYSMTTVLKGRLTTRIVIFSLRTGRVAVFRGGLGRRGFVPVVRSLSWPRNGKYLAFAVTLCPRSGPPRSTCSPWTVRSLNPAAHGGSLASGSVLLTTHAPVVINQVINPLVINPAGTGALRMSVQPPRSTANQTFRLTSISLTTGERTVLRTWVGPDIEALYATGGVVLVLSAPGRVGQFPSHRFRVIGLIGRSGKYQPLPLDRAGD